jgi:hypothetical protein
VQDTDRELAFDERVVVLTAVLLRVHHDEVGTQRLDARDIGILGAAYVLKVGAFAESRTGDRHPVPGRQRLGDRWDETNDLHAHILDEKFAPVRDSSRTPR